MPIDPQIPLQVNQLNLPATLGAATQNALRNIQVQQGQQDLQLGQQNLQSQNALRDIFSQPGAIDPQTGQVSPQAMQNVLARAPQIGMQLIQHNEQMMLRQEQIKNYQSLAAKRQADIAKEQQTEAIRRLELAHDINAKQDDLYRRLLKSGASPQEIKEQVNALGVEQVDVLQKSGLLVPELADQYRVGVTHFDPVKTMAENATQKSAIAHLKQTEKTPVAKWVDPKTGIVYGDDPTGQGALSFYNTMEGDKGWRPLQGTAPAGLQLLGGQTPEMAAAKAVAKSAATARPGMSPEDIDSLARQARAGDKSVFQNLGRGVQGARNIEAIRHRMNEIMIEAGDTPEEQAARNAEFAGITAGERTVGVREANIQMAATEAKNMIPLALKASEEANRAGIKSVNDLIQFAQGKTASPELRRLSVATNGLINVYARAISPTGVPTVSDKDHAREILDKGFANGDYAAAVDQIRLEIEQAQRSPGQVRQQMRESITGKSAPASEQKSQRTIVQQGIEKGTGRKVIKYSDGTIDYAD